MGLSGAELNWDELCIKHDVKFEVAVGGLTDVGGGDAFSKAFVPIIGVVSELEADLISDRVKSKHASLLQDGRWIERPPFSLTSEDGNLILKPNEFLRMDPHSNSYRWIPPTTGLERLRESHHELTSTKPSIPQLVERVQNAHCVR
jgi:DNA invertase Pin-like site-specific DNA recombinase